MNIIRRVERLDLPADQYVVFGSALLELHGLRKAGDIDIVVTPELFGQMAEWPEWDFRTADCGNPVLDHGTDTVEAFDHWECGGYRLETEYLLERADMIEGVPFAPLEEVLAWKGISARAKDRADTRLIEAYMQNPTSAVA